MAMLFGPLSTCPRCNQPDRYGRCLVTVKGLLFKCNQCGHHEAKELPPLAKKIIYIDQFALSKMVKNKDDPVTRSIQCPAHQRRESTPEFN